MAVIPYWIDRDLLSGTGGNLSGRCSEPSADAIQARAVAGCVSAATAGPDRTSKVHAHRLLSLLRAVFVRGRWLLGALAVVRTAIPWWSRVFRPVWLQADVLERKLGHDRSLQVIEERIAVSKRAARRRLYELHDEIARREASSSVV